jgi:hypothetical protein
VVVSAISACALVVAVAAAAAAEACHDQPHPAELAATPPR